MKTSLLLLLALFAVGCSSSSSSSSPTSDSGVESDVTSQDSSTAADSGPLDSGSSGDSSASEAAAGGDSSQGSGDSGTSGDTSTGEAGADCSPLSLTGVPTPTIQMVSQTFSTSGAAGGTIVAGTYYLTSETVFSGGTPANGRSVWLFDTSAMTLRTTAETADGGIDTSEETYTTSTTTMDWSVLCPSAVTVTGLAYTATSTSFDFYDAFGDVVLTYTKQ